jgi:hypothetical protein
MEYNKDECPICLDIFNNECKILPCKHKYHTRCINMWLERKNICPLCRFPLSTNYKCKDGRNTFFKYKITLNDDHVLFNNWFYNHKFEYKTIKSIAFRSVNFYINYIENNVITSKQFIFKNGHICENFFKSITNKFYLQV